MNGDMEQTPSRRISDIQMGALFEKVHHLEGIMQQLRKEFKDQSEKIDRKYDVNLLEMHDLRNKMQGKVGFKDCSDIMKPLCNKQLRHSVYWGLLIFFGITVAAPIAVAIAKHFIP